MPEELQHLIDRIRDEAVGKGKEEAEKILKEAREKAARMVREAEEQAQALREKAKQDAEAYTQRSRQTLEQAARDILLTIGQGLDRILAALVKEKTGQALDDKVLEELLEKVVEHYLEHGGAETRIEVLLSEKDCQKMANWFNQRFQEKLKTGVEIRADKDMVKGFKVSLSEEGAYHDFSQEAIAESVMNFLRPDLAEIVRKAIQQKP